ncbi:unnamed protein product [Cunninghamella blakesleeana]
MVHLTSGFIIVNANEKKKIAVVPSAVVCHIDESALFEQQKGASDKLEEMVKTKFPKISFISQPMEDVFSKEFKSDPNFDLSLKNTCSINYDHEHLIQLVKQSSDETSNADQLRNLFKNINKNTAKEDLYWNIKFSMLLAIARREGCDYIFMGDSSTRQAIKMISKISNGRGYSIPMDVGLEVDSCFKDVVILRPMKDMLAKEMGFYNRLHGLEHDVVAPVNFGTFMPPKSSIERLTEDFIVNLDRDFPSTVSTISRTASKLVPNSNVDYSKTCAICQMPYESNIPEWRKHSTVTRVDKVTKGECNTEECCGTGGGGCSSDKGHDIDLNAFLCYGCQVNLKDYKEDALSSLPPYVLESVHNNEREQRLRGQIEQFLINDDDDE